MIIPFTFQNINLIFVALATAGIGVLGFSVLFNNVRSITNINFFLFSVVTIIWSAANYGAYQTSNPLLSFWLFRFVIFAATWHAFFFFQTFFVFPVEKITLPLWYKFFLIPTVAGISLITLTPLVFMSIGEVASDGHIAKINNGPAIVVFSSLIGFLVISGLVILFTKIISAKGDDKKRYSVVLLGVAITFVLILVFNFILPAFFNNPGFVPLGALFIFPFVACTAYSIMRYKLFNLKIAGASTLVFLLSIVSFIEVLQTSDVGVIIYRSVIFLLVLAFGILLLRGVMREVKLREQIEGMAQDMARAYEVEKRANEELANLDKTKNQFLLTIQHHLRTPLTSMMGYADLLLNGTFGKQNKKTMEVIKRFQVSTQGLIKMVNDFLDITQFQLGKDVVSMKPGIDLTAILNEIVIELSFKAESKKIALSFEKPVEPLIISADPQKLKAAIYNVIDNSIKYTKEGSVVVSAQKSNVARILVKDTGIGISKEHLPNLFSRIFERGEEAKTFTMGSGIGLYLTAQIIKSHNGKIWAESEGEGKGSVFNVELPLSTQIAPTAKPSEVSMASKSTSDAPIKNL